MTVSLEVDKDTLLRLYGVHYKYAVLHSNGNCTWEFVTRRMTSGDPVDRILSIPSDRIRQLTGTCQLYFRL